MFAKNRWTSFLQTTATLAIVFACLFASQWQFHRGTAQMNTNAIIKSNLNLAALTSTDVSDLDPVANQWRLINVSGSFSPDKEELVRNRYYEGKYGFEVLTLFTAKTGEKFWVNRGWVAAGVNAATPPIVSKPTSGETTIKARIRSENLSRQLQGSFFVTSKTQPKPANMTRIQGIDAEPFYLDLIGSTNGEIRPLTEIQLPELSNGPHFAYALQWLAFAVLALVGRVLLFREAKRLPLV